MMRTQIVALALVALLATPIAADAQDVRQAQRGLTSLASTRHAVSPEATALQRRAGWEAGAALGAVGGLVFGRFVVVMYNDGRAEKMGTGREILTMVGAAAIGAGIGAFIQKLVT